MRKQTKTEVTTEEAKINEIIDVNSGNKPEYVNTLDENEAPSYSAMLEGFVIPNITRHMYMQFAMLSKSGNINFYVLTPLRLHDPRAQRGFEDRNFYLATSMNPNKDTSNTTGKIVYQNSNWVMLQHFLKPVLNESKNPFNALMITDSYIRPGIVPSRISMSPEEIQAINGPARALKQTIKEIIAEGYDDKRLEKELFAESYELYKKQIKELAAAGLVTTSQILMAEPNSIKPILTLDSSATAGSNEFLNVKNLLNGQSEMTWMPMLNKVFGGFNLSNESSIKGSDIKLGEIELGNGLYANSKKATATKYKENVEVVVSVKDNNRNQGQSNKSRSKSLEEAAQRQATIFSFGKLIPFVARAGEQGKTNGINQFTIELGQYYQHHSLNQTNSLEFDSLSDLTSTEEVSIDKEKSMGLDELFNETFEAVNQTNKETKSESEAPSGIDDII